MQNLTKTDLAISKIGVFYCREMDLKKKNKTKTTLDMNPILINLY